MLVYCSHCYGGNENNKRCAEEKIKKLQEQYKDLTFVSPIHTFGFMYHTLTYDEGMKKCLSLLEKCSLMVVLSIESEGVRREIEYAKQHRIPVLRMDEWGVIKCL